MLLEKFNPVDYSNPSYLFQIISAIDLKDIRKSHLGKVYETVDGTLGSHILVFQPDGDKYSQKAILRIVICIRNMC